MSRAKDFESRAFFLKLNEMSSFYSTVHDCFYYFKNFYQPENERLSMWNEGLIA